MISVRRKRQVTKSKRQDNAQREPKRIVIIGGGAAGFAAAEMLRRQGYQGSLVMLSSDTSLPYDRPNLSKDYLAGTAPFEYVPLKDERFYTKNGIETRIGWAVRELDVQASQVVLAGEAIPYDRLLLGYRKRSLSASPYGAQTSHTSTRCARWPTANRSSRAPSRHAGLSSLGQALLGSRSRRPYASASGSSRGSARQATDGTIRGTEMGNFIRSLHEQHGVVFHLEGQGDCYRRQNSSLWSSAEPKADIVVAGIGVRPRLELAEQAGLSLDRGVVVDQYLETSVPGVYAAGDIARWPDAHSGENIRVEHWVVAERQGQTAALNMLGLRRPFSPTCRFSGASTTTYRSTMSVTLNHRTRSQLTATSWARIASSAICGKDA